MGIHNQENKCTYAYTSQTHNQNNDHGCASQPTAVQSQYLPGQQLSAQLLGAGMPVMAQAQLANTVRGWLRSHVQTGILFEDEKFAKPSLLMPSVNQPPVPQAHQPETPVQTAAAPVGHLDVAAPICLSGCVSRL